LPNLDALIASYKVANQPTYNATQQDYATQLANLTGSFNTDIAQQKQVLGAIPGTYQPARESAYLANQKANLAAPAVAANQGYASGAGADYDFRQANNADWQKNVDTTNQAQNTAVQTANNGIANTQNTYNTNAGTINANEAKDLAALDAQIQAQANTEYNTEMAQAEQQREFDQQQAAASASARTAASGSGGSPAPTAKVPTLATAKSSINGLGPAAALAYLRDNVANIDPAAAAQYALYIPYKALYQKPDGSVVYTNSLDDYATAQQEGWKQSVTMVNMSGSSKGRTYTVNTIGEYNGAIAKRDKVA